MAKYLTDIGLYSSLEEHNVNFAWETNFLELLFFDCLPKVETKGISKVVVTACRSVSGDPLKLIVNPDVIEYSGVFDFDAYQKADKASRKRMALDFLFGSLTQVAKIKGWDSIPFKVAFEEVLAKKFVNERVWGKPVTGPVRMKAQTWCHFDSDKAQIYVVFSQMKKQLGRVFVTEAKPSISCINKIVGKLEWETERDVKLTSRDGLSSWRCSVPA